MEKVLSKSGSVTMYFLELFFCGDEGKYYTLANIADELNVNINTVKGVFDNLKKYDYFVPVKGKGFKINKNIVSKRENFFTNLVDLKKIINKLQNSGYSDYEILAGCFKSLKESIKSDIYYIDEDLSSLLVGKKELEDVLKVEIRALPISEAITKLEKGYLDVSIVITSYYCFGRLKKYMDKLKIIPLKVTPPIDTLINFSKISQNDSITVVTVNSEMKHRFINCYASLMRQYRNLSFVSIDEVLSNEAILKKSKYVMTLKYIYDLNRNVFAQVRNLSVYSRFQDEDGMKIILKTLNKEDFLQ